MNLAVAGTVSIYKQTPPTGLQAGVGGDFQPLLVGVHRAVRRDGVVYIFQVMDVVDVSVYECPPLINAVVRLGPRSRHGGKALPGALFELVSELVEQRFDLATF